MLDKRGMVLWSNLFHIGISGIFFGHLFGMLTPHWMYAWFLPVAVKQQMAMILGGICGVLTLIGGGATGASFNKSAYQGDVFWCGYPDPRHFVNSVHSWVNHHSFSAQHPDGSEMMKLVGWAQSIVTFGRCIYAS